MYEYICVVGKSSYFCNRFKRAAQEAKGQGRQYLGQRDLPENIFKKSLAGKKRKTYLCRPKSREMGAQETV